MRRLLALGGIGAFLVSLVVAGLPTRAADHLDGPLVRLDGRNDLLDVWVFPSPSTPGRTVLAMSVNPLAGVASPTTFNPDSQYEFMIDRDGDLTADLRFTAHFGPVRRNGTQSFRLVGPAIAASGSTEEALTLFGGRSPGRAYAGLFDDPFFLDLTNFRAGTLCPNGQGTDFFAGRNVSAVVLELNNAILSSDFGVWARVRNPRFAVQNSVFNDTPNFDQIDRAALPTVNVIFTPPEIKDAYNRGEPRTDDQLWYDDIFNFAITRGLTPDEAAAAADFVLPDILQVDLTRPIAFPNGRTLEDDVIDPMIQIFSGGDLVSDCVDFNDVPSRSTFPFLPPPH